MASNDKLSFWEIAKRWARETDEPIDAMMTDLLGAFWNGELPAIRSDNGAPISRGWVLKVLVSVGSHPGMAFHTCLEAIPERKQGLPDGGVAVDLVTLADIVLPASSERWTDADIGRASEILARRSASDYATHHSAIQIMLMLMAVSRRDFAGWYLNQNLYPRPHPDVIWPPALIPSNSDLPKPVPSGAAVDSPAEAVKSGSTVAAETKCAAWLAALMQAGPPGKAKAAYQLEALDKFPVGSRAFARAWDKAKSDVGAALAAPWQKPGRKS